MRSNLWTEDDSDLADALIAFWACHKDVQVDDIVSQFLQSHVEYQHAHVSGVWQRLQEYPHNIELAMTRRQLHCVNGYGETITPAQNMPNKILRLNLLGFSFTLDDIHDFLASRTILTEDLFQVFSIATRRCICSDSYIFPPWVLKAKKVSLLMVRPGQGKQAQQLPTVAVFPLLLSKPRGWALFVVHSTSGSRALKIHVPHGCNEDSLNAACVHMNTLFGPHERILLADDELSDIFTLQRAIEIASNSSLDRPAFAASLIRTCETIAQKAAEHKATELKLNTHATGDFTDVYQVMMRMTPSPSLD